MAERIAKKETIKEYAGLHFNLDIPEQKSAYFRLVETVRPSFIVEDGNIKITAEIPIDTITEVSSTGKTYTKKYNLGDTKRVGAFLTVYRAVE